MSVFGKVNNIEHRTNNIFRWCGAYPTIMDGLVYRHKYTEDGVSEIASSRKGVVIDINNTVHTREEIDGIIDMIERAYNEHKVLARGGDYSMREEDNGGRR